MSTAEMVNTKRVAGRRKLRFNSLEEIAADAERMASTPHKQLGNWNLGRACTHLARVLDASIDGGLPSAPWFLRTFVAPLVKNWVLNKGLPAGFKLPKQVAVNLVPDAAETEAGLAELRRAIARFQSEKHRVSSPFFGEMTNEEWNKLHLRHGELHLSFFVPI